MRILLLNLGAASLEAVHPALAGQGYDIVQEGGLTVEQVLALSPEVVITEATPSDLSCCALITQLKARLETGSSVRVVMIASGGALERARAIGGAEPYLHQEVHHLRGEIEQDVAPQHAFPS